MKNRILTLSHLTVALALTLVGQPRQAAAAQGGTDLLHFQSKVTLENTGVDADARGKIEVMIKRQGAANNQQLKISVAKLDARAPYSLVAFLGDDTNATSITSFVTDQKGSYSVAYSDKTQVNVRGRAAIFPQLLDPFCNVRELDIVDAQAATVLQGFLVQPDEGNYNLKRSLINPGFLPAARGTLELDADQKATDFRLQATGLMPNTPYILSVNDNAMQAVTTDKAGKLNLKTLPPGSPDTLDIITVALLSGDGMNLVLIAGGLGIPCLSANQAELPLMTAANFAVLAGSTVASTGFTIINGDLGLSPGSSVTGFPPGVVNGTQHVADTTADQAQLDLTTAYNDAAGRSVGVISVAGNLGGLTLPPGLYKSTSSLEISSGDLTLDAQGDVNAVFIFQMASTLITTAGRQVILSGGAKAANVFWQVGTSATLGTTSVFKGTIMADQAITLNNGATLEGRALARVAAVTLDNNTITIPAP